jgi:putative toxin-antitoxin system antitoxin component (TIGR02293 family)
MARLKTGPRRYSKKADKREAAITIESVREGLSIESLRKVAENLGIDERSLAKALNIPSRTFDRRLKVGILRPTESDSLARVARL